LYSDYVIAVDPPHAYPSNDRFASDPWFNTDEAILKLAEAVVDVELTPGKKEYMQKRGMEWARSYQNTWEAQGSTFLEFIQRCT
jgi:hypothetical protein